MSVKQAYLFTYSAVLAVGWSYILHTAIQTALQSGTKAIYTDVKTPLVYCQTAAILEIIHSAVGLVRSPFIVTLGQISSRVGIVWGILILLPESHLGELVLYSADGIRVALDTGTMIIAWCLAEIIRYTFYSFKEANLPVPYPLLWLRYTAFVILYPVGISSEWVTVILGGMPKIYNNPAYQYPMPNQINFSFDYWTVWVISLALYAPGIPMVFTRMISQRGKVLKQAAGDKKKN